MSLKRTFDFAASLIGLLLLLPVLLLIALAVKLDSPGPAFFLQERVGRHGRIFRIIKFRTMTVDAEAKSPLTFEQDARITRAGRWLRRTKIDELPQLLNVLRGEMSLVGPRPELPCYVACYPADIREVVLSVPPGVTDWASICFYDEAPLLAASDDPERSYIEQILPIKLSYCMDYVRERSFLMDLKIIFITLFSIARPPEIAMPHRGG